MKLFRNKPIRQKLMMIILITSSVVLLLTCTTYFIYEYLSFRKSLVYQTRILGQMCAANTTAALAFNNIADAQDVLSTLKVDPNIVSAILYDKNDSAFATYPEDLSLSSKIRVMKEGFYFTDSNLEGFIPVINDGKKLGTLYVLSNMQAMYDRFRLYATIALSVIIFSMFVSYLLSRVLQKNITRPILALANTAEVISDRRDYSIRARKFDNDEIGTLTTEFNNMLSEIEKQNHEILSFNQNLEVKVRNRTEELELAYSEMEAFSYSVSHDLNAPLRKIDTFIDLYLNRPNIRIDEDGKKTLEKVSSNTRKMRQLISDLLAFSQLGKKELVRTEVNMKEMARTVFDDHRRQEEERNIKFNLCEIPNAFADSISINQVWVNFISNALKYSKKNEITEIEICSEEKGDSTIYYIKDNGAGFDMKDYDKLFTAFNRLHTQRDFDGTGVGLAIVHRIISKHGGKVWATAVPDEGAIFYFSLPKKAG